MNNKKPPSDLYFLSLDAAKQSKRWFGDTENGTDLVHMTLGLCGEVGELANIIKKVDRNSADLGDAHVKFDTTMELADVFVYVLNIAALLNIDLLRAYEQKQIENERRFSIQRAKREEEKNVQGLR